MMRLMHRKSKITIPILLITAQFLYIAEATNCTFFSGFLHPKTP